MYKGVWARINLEFIRYPKGNCMLDDGFRDKYNTHEKQIGVRSNTETGDHFQV